MLVTAWNILWNEDGTSLFESRALPAAPFIRSMRTTAFRALAETVALDVELRAFSFSA